MLCPPIYMINLIKEVINLDVEGVMDKILLAPSQQHTSENAYDL